jgi:hypothetical protein
VFESPPCVSSGQPRIDGKAFRTQAARQRLNKLFLIFD